MRIEHPFDIEGSFGLKQAAPDQSDETGSEQQLREPDELVRFELPRLDGLFG